LTLYDPSIAVYAWLRRRRPADISQLDRVFIHDDAA
jgi:hypothetical protein